MSISKSDPQLTTVVNGWFIHDAGMMTCIPTLRFLVLIFLITN